MKRFIKKIIPVQIRQRIRQFKFTWIDEYGVSAYSQEGEDMLLRKIFADKAEGFYVDVGAHHPQRLSNTYYFYKKGWSGINIDAMPGSMSAFRHMRPRDINLEVAIAEEAKEMTFYIFNEQALNSFDEALSRSRENDTFRIVAQQKVVTKTLAEVLKTHLSTNQVIDFLTIDVEGLDLDVLQSNDWQRFRPQYVLAECYGVPFEQIHNHAVYQFLKAQEYNLFAKTHNTYFFVNNQ